MIPITKGYDDDLYFNPNQSKRFSKLNIIMRFIDSRIGLMDNNFKIEELIKFFELSGNNLFIKEFKNTDLYKKNKDMETNNFSKLIKTMKEERVQRK